MGQGVSSSTAASHVHSEIKARDTNFPLPSLLDSPGQWLGNQFSHWPQTHKACSEEMCHLALQLHSM